MHDVTHMYVFGADHLALDNQSMCSSLEKTICPAHRLPLLPIALCVGLRLWAFSPFHISVSVGVVLFRLCLAAGG